MPCLASFVRLSCYLWHVGAEKPYRMHIGTSRKQCRQGNVDIVQKKCKPLPFFGGKLERCCLCQGMNVELPPVQDGIRHALISCEIFVPEARSLTMEIPEVRRSWSRCLHLRLFLRCWQSCVDSMARDLHHSYTMERCLMQRIRSMFDDVWCMQHVQLRMETIPTFEIPRSARYEEIVNLSCFEPLPIWNFHHRLIIVDYFHQFSQSLYARWCLQLTQFDWCMPSRNSAHTLDELINSFR